MFFGFIAKFSKFQDVTIINREPEQGVAFKCQRYAGSALCAFVSLIAFLRWVKMTP